jgi:uncharacterized protein YjdB
MEGASAATIVFEEDITIQKTTMDEPASITADELETLKANPFRAKAVTFKATAVKSGKYLNWKLGDILLSYKSKPDSMPSLVEGVEYTVKGYLLSYNSSSNYFPVAAVSVEGTTEDVATLDLDKSEVSVGVGDDVAVTATVTPAKAIQNVKWESADPTIATVNSKGVITGVAVGTTKVTATTEGKTSAGQPIVKEVAVTVTEAAIKQLPFEGDFSASTGDGAVLPYGWTAKTNEGYAGGLKANKDGYWVLSREFAPTSKGVDVTITVAKLNPAQGTGAADEEAVFLVEGFDSVEAGATAVATARILGSEVKAAGDFKASLHGTDIKSVKVTLNKRPTVDGNPNNVNISKIALAEGTDDPTQIPDATKVTLNKSTLDLLTGREETLVASVEPERASQKVVWTSSNSAVATVSNGKVTAVAAGTATIRATAEGHENIYAECVVTVTQDSVNYGTETAPLSVAEGNAIINALDDAGSTPVKMTVKGIVTRFVSATAFWIKDETTDAEVEVYFFDVADGVAAPAVNDTIVVKGDGKKYVDKSQNVTLEITGAKGDSPKILSNVRGTSAVTLGAHEHATVTGLPEGGTAVNGSKVEFTVTPDDGYDILEVKAGGVTLTAGEGGKYSFTVAGPAEVVVSTKNASDKSEKLTLDFAVGPTWSTASTDADKLVEFDGFDLTFNTMNAYNTQKYLMLAAKNKSNAALFANKTAIGGAITKIEFTTTSSCSSKAEFKFALGSTAIAADFESTNTHKGQGTFSLEATEADGFNYFALACTTTGSTGYNGQIASIVITFIPTAD